MINAVVIKNASNTADCSFGLTVIQLERVHFSQIETITLFVQKMRQKAMPNVKANANACFVT
ncbi:hypothetical protein CV014_08630 [Nostoc sp. CMAA1605]|nr:hypothetical protein [Nostoc sp. CMAA1605]